MICRYNPVTFKGKTVKRGCQGSGWLLVEITGGTKKTTKPVRCPNCNGSGNK